MHSRRGIPGRDALGFSLTSKWMEKKKRIKQRGTLKLFRDIASGTAANQAHGRAAHVEHVSVGGRLR